MNDCDSESTLFFCVRVARAVCILGDVTEVKRSLAPFFLCLALLPLSFFSQPYKNPKYDFFFIFFLDNFRRPEKIKKTLEKISFIKENFACQRPRGGAHSEEEEEEEDARRREHRNLLLTSSSLRAFFLKEQKKRRNGIIIIIFNREEWLCLFERIGIE